MKKVLTKTIIVIVVVLLLPFIFTLMFHGDKNNVKSLASMNFKVYYESDGKQEDLDFDQYLIGVVAANMPAGYNIEALKTQALIARTYALYNMSLLSEDTDKTRFSTSELGLSYMSLSKLEQYWGNDDYVTYFTKIENSVYGTKDEVLTYDGSFILPVFFDTGSGFTRNASEAWGVDIPYLVSVPSKEDVTSINYLKISEYALPDMIATLQKQYPDIDITEKNFFDKVKVSERDSAGYVTKIDLGSKSVPGEEFAKVVGINSNHFYIEDYEGKVRIICNGVGHGVGLSQYGANVMAENGSSYKDILTHYYTGVNIVNLDGKA